MGKRKRRTDAMAFERVMEHMPVGDDPTLAVLKAHLLVEEQIWAVVSARLGLSEKLLAQFESRFQSSRDIALIAEALVPPNDVAFYEVEWIWTAIERLNSLRNRLAHELEPSGVKEGMADLVKCVSSPEECTEDLRIDFYLAAFTICERLEKLRRPIDATDYQDAF
jgi:hypothetical protein